MFEHLNNRYEREDFATYLREQDVQADKKLNEQAIDYELQEDINDFNKFAIPC